MYYFQEGIYIQSRIYIYTNILYNKNRTFIAEIYVRITQHFSL